MGTAITSANDNYIRLGNRVVIRTSTGKLYAVIHDYTDDAVEVWYSADGSSWSQKDSGNSPLWDGGFHGAVACAIDGNDILHIIYPETNYVPQPDEGRFMYVTFDTCDGGDEDDAFNTPEECLNLGANNVAEHSVAIAIDSNNVPHIAISGGVFAGKDGYYTIFYANKVGGSWNTKVEVEGVTNTKNCYSPQIEINDDNYPVICYINDTDSAIGAALGNANNATSFTLKDVDESIANVNPSICVDSNGDVWIGYVDSDLTVDIAKQSSNWTDAWTITSDGDTGATSVSIAANGTDIYVFYEDDNHDIVYNKYDGGWDGETTLETGTYEYVKAKWSNYHNNQGNTQIDYLFMYGDDIYWNKLTIGGETYEKEVSEIIGLKDTLAELQPHKVVSEQLGLLEAIEKKTSIVKTELLGLLEGISKQTKITKSEMLGLYDPEPTKEKKAVKEVSDQLGLLDATPTFVVSIERAEIIGLLESLSKQPKKALSELLGLTDDYVLTAKKNVSELLGLLDNLDQLQPHKQLSEQLGLLEAIEKKIAIVKTEMLGLSEAIEKQPHKQLSEMLGLYDEVDTHKYMGKTVEDYLGLLDNLDQLKISKQLSEQLGLLESIEKQAHLVKTDILGLVDVCTKVAKKNVAEILGLAESLINEISKVITEQLGLVENKTLQPHKLVADQIGLAESLIKETHLVLSEILGLLEALEKTPSILKSELLGLYDEVDNEVIPTGGGETYEKEVSEIIGLVDTIIKQPQLVLEEKLELLEAIRPRIKQLKKTILRAHDIAQEIQAGKDNIILRDMKKDDEIQSGG